MEADLQNSYYVQLRTRQIPSNSFKLWSYNIYLLLFTFSLDIYFLSKLWTTDLQDQLSWVFPQGKIHSIENKPG